MTVFADDFKIDLEITHVSDLPYSQKSIDDIATWSSKWQLKLAINKFQHIHISISLAVPQFWVHSNISTNSILCCDLGVIIDSRLSFGNILILWLLKPTCVIAKFYAVFLVGILIF